MLQRWNMTQHLSGKGVLVNTVMATVEMGSMARSRAVLTELEREQIAGEHGDKRKYEATSRARRRIKEELTTDLEVFAEHHPELLDEVTEVVRDVDTDEGGSEA